MSKSKFNLNNYVKFNHNEKKNDWIRISPSVGTSSNLNKAGNIIFSNQQTSNPLNICEASLYFKIKIDLKSTDDMTLENNFFPQLFSTARLSLGTTEVENIENPGAVSSLLNFVLIDSKDKGCTYSGWIPDKTDSSNENSGYKKRKLLYNAEG